MPIDASYDTVAAGFTRREFVVTALTAGFAAAVSPVTAATIATSADGLEAGEVKIPVAGGEMPAYRAAPRGTGPFATVLVVQEVFGVHEHIRDLCRRLARIGYLAIAPELYARQGDVSKIADIKDLMPIVQSVPDAQVMADLDAAAAWAAASAHGDPARLAMTGFCWGGRITWLYCAHSARVKAGVAWYGRLDGERTALQPQYPIDLAARLRAPVLGLYAGHDRGIPLASVEAMRTALKSAPVGAEIVVYPDAEHGFNADYRPSYDAQAAADGWRRMREWFAAHGASAAHT
ncbi:MAG: dienelactone hydrolase family protein [Gammaproteobacteria bacterium]